MPSFQRLPREESALIAVISVVIVAAPAVVAAVSVSVVVAVSVVVVRVGWGKMGRISEILFDIN